MRTNVEFTQSGRKLGGKRIFLIFGAVVAAMMLATPAPAQTNAVSDALWAGADQIVQAATAAGGGDSTSAISALDTATNLLQQAQAALQSSGLSAKVVKTLGKGIVKANNKLLGLENYLDGSKWTEKAAVSKLASAAKSLQKLANYAGAPLLEEVTPNNSAGFLKAGSVVTMAFAIPPSCGTDWTVTCTAAPGVIASYTPDYTTGTIIITMGSTQGGADVSIKGCDCAVECCSRELYNYGGSPTSSEKFPKLPQGNYDISYSLSIADFVCCSGDPQTCVTTYGSSYGPTSLGTFPLYGNMKIIEQVLEEAFSEAVAESGQPDCTQHVTYSPFSDDTFTVTYTVNCSSPGCTGGATTFSFTLQKQ